MLVSSLYQGLSFSIMALGIVISFRFLDFPDLTVDGSFALGGAISASLMVSGLPPAIAVLLATLGGFMAGSITGSLHAKLRISKLLSGILMMIMLYSINLRIMGRPNIPLINRRTVTDFIHSFLPLNGWDLVIFFFVVSIVIKEGLDFLLRTEWGTAMRSVGDNETLVRNLGLNINQFKIAGLGVSNALVALSGALVCQYQGFADVGMGIGMIIIGIASIIIGETVIRVFPYVSERKSIVWQRTSAALIGSVIYQLIVNIGLRLGLAPTDLRLATGVLVVIALSVGLRRKVQVTADRY